jgi:hypothetical protein
MLELIGTTDARDLLKSLAGGVPDAYLTSEAKGCLERLEKKASSR